MVVDPPISRRSTQQPLTAKVPINGEQSYGNSNCPSAAAAADAPGGGANRTNESKLGMA